MWDYPIARTYADARIVKIAGGSIEIMKTIVAREIFKKYSRARSAETDERDTSLVNRQAEANVSGPIQSGDTILRKHLDNGLRFGFLIHDVSRMRRIVVDRALKPMGVTRSQWWVLAFLSRRDGMKITALASDLDLTKMAVGGLIKRMEASGFVERRDDNRDGRAKRIFLTAKGQRLVNRIRANVEEVEADILSTVSETELDEAAETLVKIKQRLLEILEDDVGVAGPD